MGLFDNLGFKNFSSVASNAVDEIFAFQVKQDEFVNTDIETIYSRILTDVLERTNGIPDELEPLLWDNCVKTNVQKGVITLISEAMVKRSDLFLVYNKTTKIVTVASQAQEEKIKRDYETQAGSSEGVYISFKNYKVTMMMKIYSALDYCSVASLWKSMNLSKAILLKIKNLRAGVSLTDKDAAVEQGRAIAKGIGEGKDAMLDADDSIETTKPDLTATEKAMEFVSRKQSLYLGLPSSYINGILKGGLGDSGEADSRAIERGLKKYFYSVIKPVSETLFALKEVEFKSEDHTDWTSALDTLKTFELTSEQYISSDNKQLILNRKFNLADDAKGDKVTASDVDNL